MAIKIILGVIALLLAAGAGVYIKISYEQRSMSPLATGEVVPGIFAVKANFVNFYLIKSGEGYIAVDAGMSKPAAEKELQSLGISAADVSAVLLTHAHGDHTGALTLLGNADVYVGAGGASGRFANAKTLTDGESVTLAGTTIQCIATPGHTDSSVCFLVEGKYLFSGDTLSLHGGQVGLFNSFFNKSDKAQADSIQKLAALEGVQYVFSAHHGYAESASFPAEMK